MFDALGCFGVARIDFFLTNDGLVLNEVNTMPGMTAESQVPRMFAVAGVPYGELVARLVGAATVPTTMSLADDRKHDALAPEKVGQTSRSVSASSLSFSGTSSPNNPHGGGQEGAFEHEEAGS
jgi:hypothetical protein